MRCLFYAKRFKCHQTVLNKKVITWSWQSTSWKRWKFNTYPVVGLWDEEKINQSFFANDSTIELHTSGPKYHCIENGNELSNFCWFESCSTFIVAVCIIKDILEKFLSRICTTFKWGFRNLEARYILWKLLSIYASRILINKFFISSFSSKFYHFDSVTNEKWNVSLSLDVRN